MEQNSPAIQIGQIPSECESVAVCTRVLSPDQDCQLQSRGLEDHTAATELERSLILEPRRAGQIRYKQDFESGRVGKTVHSRSGRDLPPHRPKRIFDHDEVVRLRNCGLPLREIAKRLGLGLGTVTRAVQEGSARPAPPVGE